MGVVIDRTAYFSFHALSGGGGDAIRAIRQILNWYQTPGNGNHVDDVIIGGDFNVSPNDLQDRIDRDQDLSVGVRPHIYSTNRATQRSGNELDYFVHLHYNNQHPNLQATPIMEAIHSDHAALMLGGIRGSGEMIETNNIEIDNIEIDYDGTYCAESENLSISWNTELQEQVEYEVVLYKDEKIELFYDIINSSTFSYPISSSDRLLNSYVNLTIRPLTPYGLMKEEKIYCQGSNSPF